MVIVFALLAALSNAVNEATQHVASTAAPRRSSGWRLVLYLFRDPLWLFGWVALAGAFVFQALALALASSRWYSRCWPANWSSCWYCAGSGFTSQSG